MKKLSFILFAFCLSITLNAQVKIGSNPNTINSNAIFELESNDKGFLPPRLTTIQRNQILSPSAGLVIYNTTTNCLNYYNGSSWNEVCGNCTPGIPASPGSISGSANQCANANGLTYSINSVANASTYNWTVPAGWTIVSGQGTTSITVTAGAAGQNGTITVNAQNACGTSANNSLNVTVTGLPTNPVAATHTATGTQIVWNWNVVAGATGYKYNTVNNFATATSTVNTSFTQTGLTCNTNYTLYVWAENSCGSSTVSTFTQTSGACYTPGSQNYTTPGAYTFTVPAGVTSIQIECWGAKGQSASSGNGGYSKGTYATTPGTTLYIYVGGRNGYNGGGTGASGYNGGGGSDVRVVGTSYSDRIIVAGGGGGGYGGNYGSGGAGGGGSSCSNGAGGGGGIDCGGPCAPYTSMGGAGTCTTGGASGYSYGGFTGGAGGGGLTSGGTGANNGGYGTSGGTGTLGIGGNTGTNGSCGTQTGGGGGGGYYGGGGSAQGQCYSGGAGGGSSWAAGFLTNLTFTGGINTTDGKVTLTW